MVVKIKSLEGSRSDESTNRLSVSYKNEFFDIVDDDSLMTNHERGKKDLLISQLKMKKFYGLFLWVVKLINIRN